MTRLDTVFLPLAERLINEFGKVVIFTSAPLPGEYDRNTGVTTPTSQTTHTAKVSPPDPYKKFFIDGDLIQAGDAKVLLGNQGNDFTPVKGGTLNGWNIDIDSICWEVISTNPIYSGESIAAWELQIRS